MPSFQGIFPTQEWNPGLLHCMQILYHLSHQGSPTYKLALHKPIKNKLRNDMNIHHIFLTMYPTIKV